MTATTLEIMSMTQFDFKSLQLNKPVSIPIAQNIDVTSYKKLTLSVRIHDASVIGSGTPANVNFTIASVAPSREDPSKFFVGAAKAAATAINTALTSPITPILQEASSTTPLGSFVSLYMNVTNWTGSSTAFSFTASAELTLRDD